MFDIPTRVAPTIEALSALSRLTAKQKATVIAASLATMPKAERMALGQQIEREAWAEMTPEEIVRASE